MERSPITYKSPPDEFLLNLFQSATQEQLCTYALVCKAWTKPAQAVLYSNVTITSLSQLEKFHNIVEHTAHLGGKVKVFNLKIKIPYNSRKDANKAVIIETTKLLSNLLYQCLPNLEELNEDTLYSYIPVLDALKDSRLKHLKRLNTPTRDMEKEEVVIYASCISLMQDRVENIAIAEGKGETVKLKSHSLYGKLGQFDKLRELDIRDSQTLSIQDLEDTVATCKSLRKLKFKTKLCTDSSISTDEIPNVIPCHNIESLEGDQQYILDEKMLLYIMHKFPKLHTSSLDTGEFVNELKQDTIVKTLEYSTGIENFSVRELRVRDRSIMGIIENFWKTTNSKSGSKGVKIAYYDIPDGDKRFGIAKSKNLSKTSFIYPVSDFYDDDLLYVKFLEGNGNHIGAFQFDYSTDDYELDLPYKCELPKNFMDHLFTHCQHLKTLELEGCALKHCMLATTNFPLEELRFKKCIFFGRFLNQLSMTVPEVKRLYLNRNTYCAKVCKSSEYRHAYANGSVLKIDMSRTKIGSIIFENCRLWRVPYYIKLNVVSQKTNCFYRYEGGLHTSNQKEYPKTDDDYDEYMRIEICCLTKPNLEFK